MDGTDGQTGRPFYDEYAWAFDLVNAQPVGRQCDFIADAFARRGVARGAKVLDAGCGTGRYSVELARRGFRVTGLDASPGLIDEARGRAGEASAAHADPREVSGVSSNTGEGPNTDGGALRVSFVVGDILAPAPGAPFDALLCRGVLNDLTDDASRGRAFSRFARALRGAGALVFDVREWEATARRKSAEPVFEKTVETERGALTFRSGARLDTAARRLLVSERHVLERPDGSQSVSDYEFAMRCWTRAEIDEALAAAGFRDAEFFGAYDRSTRAGETDRLVCVATRGD